ncbi:MAG: hypothetical protein RLZZ117_982 [Cyanobacteriota bacterium]|jgi:hypothetical protein
MQLFKDLFIRQVRAIANAGASLVPKASFGYLILNLKKVLSSLFEPSSLNLSLQLCLPSGRDGAL